MPDFDPCGFAIDFVRSCYRTKMTFFINRPEIETEVIWEFADNAPPLPFPTRFASGNWASARWDWPGLGEVIGARRKWSNGAASAVWPLVNPAGTAAQFGGGTYYPPVPFPRTDGIPDCCQSPVCWGGPPPTPQFWRIPPIDGSDPPVGTTIFNSEFICYWDSPVPGLGSWTSIPGPGQPGIVQVIATAPDAAEVIWNTVPPDPPLTVISFYSPSLPIVFGTYPGDAVRNTYQVIDGSGAVFFVFSFFAGPSVCNCQGNTVEVQVALSPGLNASISI